MLGTAGIFAGSFVAYFGGAGGISVLFGGVGAGLTGWRMARRTSGLSQFAFLPVRGSSAGLSVYLFVPGFLRDPADLFRTWGASDGVYSVIIKLPDLADGSVGQIGSDGVSKSLVHSLGMQLTRDADTGDMVVSWVDPGGNAERAGIAEGSVLTALAGGVHPNLPRRVQGSGDDTKDTSLLQLSQVRAILAGCERSASAGVVQADSGGPSTSTSTSSSTTPAQVELWLRRNLSAGANVETMALRRRPKPQLWTNSEGNETHGVDGNDERFHADACSTTEAHHWTDEASSAPISKAAASANAPLSEMLHSLSMSSFPTSAFSSSATTDTETPEHKTATETAAAAAAAALASQWPIPHGEQHVVGWEHALLMDLGGAMSSFGHEALAGYVGGKAISFTVLASLAAAVAWPVTLLKSAAFIDSPWALVELRSKAAGEELAAALLGRQQGLRPVTLVGYSLGARVIKHAVDALDAADMEGRADGRGLIQDVVLVGAPLDTSAETWAPLRRVAAGRVVNCCMSSTGDWMLQFVYRTNTMVVRHGMAAWSKVKHPGVENVDVSGVCKQHMDIPDDMPRILAAVGLQ